MKIKLLILLFLGFFACTNAQTYCTAISSQSSEDEIFNVKILGTSLDNASTCATTGIPATSTLNRYSDYTNIITQLIPGTTYTIQVVHRECTSVTGSVGGAVFIDYNDNGTWNLPLDRVCAWSGTPWPGTTPTTLSCSFTVPTVGVALGQNTRMRVVIAESMNGNTTNGCTGGTWGEVEDYTIKLGRHDTDLQVVSLITPIDGCTLDNVPVSVNAINNGDSAITDLSLSYSLDGGTPITQTFGPLASTATQICSFSPSLTSLSYGEHTIKVWTNENGDKERKNDTLFHTFVNFEVPLNPITRNDTICFGSINTNAIAWSNPPFITKWYKDATMDTLVYIGDTLKILNPNKDTTFYTKSVNLDYRYTGVPGIPTNGSYITNTGRGLQFNVFKPSITIETVDFYTNNPGVITIRLLNSSNATIITQDFLATKVGLNTIPLNFIVPMGTGYKLVLLSGTGSHGVSTSPGYPITLPNIMSITGNSSTTSSSEYSYFYNWKINYDACESAQIPVSIKYMPMVTMPVDAFSDIFEGCEFPGVILDAQNDKPGTTYKWSDGSTNQTISVTNSGLYSVDIRNSVGCTYTDKTNVVIASSPIFSLGNDVTFCSNEPITIQTGYKNRGFNHVWSTGEVATFITPTSSGEYSCYLYSTETNCGYRDTINVVLNEAPLFILGSDTSICFGTTKTISGPTGNYSYLWSDGDTSSSKIINSSSAFSLLVTDSLTQCKYKDTININVVDVPQPDLGPDITLCGQNAFLNPNVVGSYNFFWSNGSTDTNLNVTSSGTYIVQVSEPGTQCVKSDTVNVVINKDIPLSLGPDIKYCGTTYRVTAPKGFNSYQWSSGPSTDFVDVVSTGNYVMTAESACGTKKDTIRVELFQLPTVTLPNDTTVCNSFTVSIPPQASTDTVKWSNGSRNNSIQITETGQYHVEVSNYCGAIGDAINVKFDSTPILDIEYTSFDKLAKFRSESTNAETHSWDFGDNSATSDEDSPYHEYNKDGFYSVTYTVTSLCGYIADTTFTIEIKSSNSSIQDPNLTDISIYPNPVKDFVNIKLKDPTNSYRVELYNINGQLISHYNLSKSISEIKINMNDFPSALYFIKFIDKDNLSYIQKLTKN